MSFDFGELIGDLAPTLVQGGISLVGNSLMNNDIEDASADFSKGAFQAAERINQGYDEQLGFREQGSDSLRQILDAGLVDTSTLLELASGKYGDELAAVARQYATDMGMSLDNYGQQMTTGASLYGMDTGITEQEAGQLLREGSEGFQEEYAPYTDTGDEALQLLREIMAINPEELTPGQRIILDKYMNDALATLSASNLRGAGRAGVASVNEGRARLYADLFDQNQQRRDRAIELGMRTGYDATGKTAANIQSLGDSLSDLRFKTGVDAARTQFTTGKDIAKTGLNLAKDVYGKAYTAGNTAAQADYNTTRDVSNLTGQYYGNVGNVEGNRYQTRGDTAFGKAVNDASALGTVTSNNFNTATHTANNTGNVLGQIAGAAGQAVKGTIDRSRQNDKPAQAAAAL